MQAGLEAVLAPWAQLHGSAADFERVWQDVEEKQALSLTAKRRLADDTKNFKRLADVERLNAIPELLKAYQAEIDSLSKRAKFAEAGLGELLGAIRVLPEPSVVKAAVAVAQASDAQRHSNIEEILQQRDIQIEKLKEAVRDLEAELTTVTNQAATVRRLEKQLKEQEVAAEAKVEEVKRQKDEEWELRMEELRQAVSHLEQERDRQEQDIDRLQQQQLEEQRWAEEAALARAAAEALVERERLRTSDHEDTHAAVQLLQCELEGAQLRAAALEREVAELQGQLAEVREHDGRLQHDLQHQLRQFETALAAKDSEVSALREQLASRPSLNEVSQLRQQLRNVETVELSDESGAATDLERRLLHRQRVLEGQLTDARVRAEELSQENLGVKTRLQVAEDDCKDLRRLVGRLEAQLAGSGGAAPATELLTPLMPLTPLMLLPAGGPGGCSGSGTCSEGTEAMPSILEIVTGQRDRLRTRAGELEQERDHWKTLADQERKRGDQFHADNVKLLERTRFLQSMQPKAGGRGRGRSKPSADADLESRYGAAYEDGLNATNPFDQFREEEKALRAANMSAGERLLVLIGSLLVSSKIARVFTLGYTLALHLLVFLVLARLSHRSA